MEQVQATKPTMAILYSVWQDGSKSRHVFLSPDGDSFLEVGNEPDPWDDWAAELAQRLNGKLPGQKTLPLRYMRRYLVHQGAEFVEVEQ